MHLTQNIYHAGSQLAPALSLASYVGQLFVRVSSLFIAPIFILQRFAWVIRFPVGERCKHVTRKLSPNPLLLDTNV
jgi:hypothetical protein